MRSMVISQVSSPAELVESSPILLRRPAGAPVPLEHRSGELAVGGRRAVVDDTAGGDRRPDPLVDHRDDLENPFAITGTRLDPISHADATGRLGPLAVDPDVTAPAGGGRLRPGLEQAHGPQPLIDACRLDAHSVTERPAGQSHSALSVAFIR